MLGFEYFLEVSMEVGLEPGQSKTTHVVFCLYRQRNVEYLLEKVNFNASKAILWHIHIGGIR
jgi:hypothetical protein